MSDCNKRNVRKAQLLRCFDSGTLRLMNEATKRMVRVFSGNFCTLICIDVVT